MRAHTSIGSRAVMLGSLLLSSLFSHSFADNATSSSITFSDDNVKLAINVPEGSNMKDLYFHFEAPLNDHNWAGFGLGTQMHNSLIFVAYRSSGNQGEPTLSPRIGQQHRMPIFTNSVNVSVLSGSEVTNNNLVLNFHCIGCRDWSQGKLDVSSTNAPFFWALGPSGSLNSDDTEVHINRHDVHSDIFTLNMQAATGTPGVPVIGSASDKAKNGTEVEDDGPRGFDSVSRGVAAHGFLMGFAFSIIFPGGYLFLRLFEKVWLHWAIQSAGVVFTFLGVGSGIAVSIREDLSPKLTHPHQIIGLITFFVVLAAWTVGLTAHMIFKRKGVPSPIMKGHRVLGPLAITLGFVNACIGLAWAGKAYRVIGYVIFDLLVVIVIGSLVFLKKKRNMKKNAMNTAAAYNFREGNTAYSHVRGGSMDRPPNSVPPTSGYGQNMPMQTFGQPLQHGQPTEMATEYYNIRPNK